MHARCFSLPTFRGVDVTEREMKKAFSPSGYVSAPESVLEEKREKAIEYLRSRGKYVLDPGCTFTPTSYTDQFSIVERYREAAGKAGRVMAG